jgi:hypothetical protein
MIDIVMAIFIACWFYITASERSQSRAVWVAAGLVGYFAGEFALGWTAARLIVGISPDLWFLQHPVIITAGLLGMFGARWALLRFMNESATAGGSSLSKKND